MPRPCSNDSPCLLDGPGAHAPVCRKLREQGARPRPLPPGSRFLGQLKGVGPARIAALAGEVAKRSGAQVLVVQDDAPPVLIGADGQKLELDPAAPRPLIGCGCGREWLPNRQAEQVRDGVRHRYGRQCKPVNP